MNKIGIITTQYSPNYGALLQAFALQEYLKRNYPNFEIEIIDYYPQHADGFWKLFHEVRGYKDILLNVYSLLHPKLLLAKKKNFNEFKRFIAQNLNCSQRYYSFSELEKLEQQYNTLICGSDQIWNITRHDDPAWFLYFSRSWKNCKKIAYAPSVADTIPHGHENNLLKYLNNLDSISVREDIDVEQLKKYTNKDVKHVCDPIFLLTHDEWKSYLPGFNIKEPYILCYFISVGDFAFEAVKKLREITGLKVLYINVNMRDKLNSDYDIRTASPFEFVNYIRNASYVCTNSFHCTAFSILFKKNFFVIRKQMANRRMESLIRVSRLKDRFLDEDNIKKLDVDKLQTDYSACNMERFISESKQYIEESLNAGE